MRKTAALFLLLVLSASACARTVSATEIVTKSPTALFEKRTSKIALDMEFSGSASGQEFLFRTKGDGVQDYVDRKARIVLSVTGQGIPDLPSQEIIVDGDFAYNKAPCSTGPLTGKTWVKVDQRKLAGLNPSSVASNDPTTFLEGLRGAENIEKVGIEKVRGVSTTHYKMKINQEKALEQLTAERRAQVEGLFGTAGPGILADVWIDDDGLPRRYSSSFESGAESPTAFKVKMTFESYDYGTRLDVKIPPDDQVYLVADPMALATICAPTSRPQG